jgi:hypothetical protein
MRFESGPLVSMLGGAIAFVVAIALPMGAHHTHPPGLFNDTFSDIQGVVREVRLTPPHSWVMLEVRGDDGVPATLASGSR